MSFGYCFDKKQPKEFFLQPCECEFLQEEKHKRNCSCSTLRSKILSDRKKVVDALFSGSGK